MDAPNLEDRYLAAGKEFNTALENLGLDAEALFWAFDEELEKHVLVLITDFFDFKGPLEISKQLFKAYNASITPREIDPFVIQLHSIEQTFSRDLKNFVGGDWKILETERNNPPAVFDIEAFSLAGLQFQKDWVIKVKKPVKRKSVEMKRRWDRFSNNVQKAAA